MAGRRGDGSGDIDWSRVDWGDLTGLRRRARRAGRGVSAVVLVLVVLFVVPLLIGPLVTFWTDLLWFRSVGFEAVYLRRYTAAFLAFVAFFFLFFVFAALNAALVARPRLVPRVIDVERPLGASPVTARRIALVLLVPSLFFGLAAADRWDDLLRFLSATPFDSVDPLFGQDVSFYFFTLPVASFVRGWATVAVVVVAVGVVALYVARGALGLAEVDVRDLGGALLALARPARAHLSLLGALFLILIAVGYQLDRYELLFRQEAPFLTGAGYTSVNARLPALTILTAVAALAAALLVANVWARTLWLLGGTLAVWLIAAVLVGGVYPALVERFIVQPAQPQLEREFIARHITSTRAAYGIDRLDARSFDVRDQPTAEDVRRELASVENFRLWDYRPLLVTLPQLQAFRSYYEFRDVDVTRVIIDGKPQQLMVAARELNPSRVPQQWPNLHLQFTHGYGAVATPVAGVTPEGLPALSLLDLPPRGQPRIDRPEIYYGEETIQYVIVGTSQAEFDYPKEAAEQTTRFAGQGGIGVGGLWDRLLFALRFGDVNLLISTQLTSESRLLMHRHIVEREQLIAPFLRYDHDPYLAFEGGKLFWIHDAYTVGKRYPYSEPLSRFGTGGLDEFDVNYVRNSVKVVTDAYDGSIAFYIADPRDPVVRTLAAIYPGLFKPLGDMPAGLRSQLRYPEDLFRVQTAIYGRFHVTDPAIFYNNSDVWQIATEILEQAGRPQAIEPYYVITRLPDADRPEFILFVPMTPSGRQNMIAWLAGRSDEPHYGELSALRFATDRTIFGPLQIEARINQEPTIQSQLALLSQAGSRVIRGNLLVIPVGSSFIYVEPLFIVAQSGGVPELRRVVLATQNSVVMEDTFPKSLARLVGAAVQPEPPPRPQPPPAAQPPAITAEVQDVIRSASEHHAKAMSALRAGDFATFGSELSALDKDLARLRELAGLR